VTADSEKVLHTPHAPRPVGPYAQGRTGTLSGRWITTAGQVGIDPATGKIVDGGVAAETDQALRNLQAVLAAGHAKLSDVVKTTVFLLDMAEFQAMNEVYARYFLPPVPARSTVAVHQLPLGARVEIEVWAFLS